MQLDHRRSDTSRSGTRSGNRSPTALMALCALTAIAVRTVSHPFVHLTATAAVITITTSAVIAAAVVGRPLNIRVNRWNAIPLLAVGPIGLSAWRSSPTNGDVDLYHHQAISMQTVGDVPAGMANVHDRLGFISGIHPLGAIFEALAGSNGSRLATTAVALLALSALGDSLRRIRCGTALDGDLARVAALCILSAHALLEPSYWLSSPSPDLPFALTTVVASTAGLSVFGTSDAERESHVLIIYSALAIWLRPLGIVVVPIVILGLVRHRLVPPVRLCATIGVTLVIRFLFSIYTSGHLLFPIETPGWQPPWSVSAESMAATSAVVRSWARHPRVDPAVVLADWEWIQWWWSHHGPRLWLLAAALLLSFLFIVIRSSRKTVFNDLVVLALLFGPIAGWFASAPDPRFALGYLVLPPCVAASSAFRRLGPSPVRQRVVSLVVATCASLVVALPLLIAIIQRSPSSATNSAPEPPATAKPTVLVPVDGRCRRELWCNPQEPVLISTHSLGPLSYITTRHETRP